MPVATSAPRRQSEPHRQPEPEPKKQRGAAAAAKKKISHYAETGPDIWPASNKTLSLGKKQQCCKKKPAKHKKVSSIFKVEPKLPAAAVIPSPQALQEPEKAIFADGTLPDPSILPPLPPPMPAEYGYKSHFEGAKPPSHSMTAAMVGKRQWHGSVKKRGLFDDNFELLTKY